MIPFRAVPFSFATPEVRTWARRLGLTFVHNGLVVVVVQVKLSTISTCSLSLVLRGPSIEKMYCVRDVYSLLLVSGKSLPLVRECGVGRSRCVASSTIFFIASQSTLIPSCSNASRYAGTVSIVHAILSSAVGAPSGCTSNSGERPYAMVAASIRIDLHAHQQSQ